MKNVQIILLLLTLFSCNALYGQAETIMKKDSAGIEHMGIIQKRCTGQIDTLFYDSYFGWTTGLTLNDRSSKWSIRNGYDYISLEGVECVYWEKRTNWETEGTVPEIKFPDEHEWVYAAYRDVNPGIIPFASTAELTLDTIPSGHKTSVCASDGYQKEARICRYCKTHQTREKRWGYTEKNVVSEYAKLLKQKGN